MSEQRVTLEEATKEELLSAINAEFFSRELIQRMLTHIYWLRVQRSDDIMREACDEMEANLQSGGQFDAEKRKRWQAANKKWEKANKELTKLLNPTEL